MSLQQPVVFARRIANLTDARYYAAKEVAWLFFNLEPGTEGYLDPMYMQAMREWVEGPGIGGEFEHSSVEIVNESAAFYQLGAVIVPASMDLMALTPEQIFVKIAIDTPDLSQIMEEHADRVAGWILELPEGTTSWLDFAEEVQPLTDLYHIVLQYNAPAEEVKDVLSSVTPWGIGLTGGEEEAVGVKSFDEVENVFLMMNDEI